MELIDSSAWVEFLRATGSPTHERVRDLLAADGPIATTDVVLMEILAGARDVEERDRLRRLLLRATYQPVEAPRDFELAADLYRQCRSAGETVRKLTDCLIAAVAIRLEVPLLHRDGDFDVLARHTALQLSE